MAKAENISHNLCLLLSAEESWFIFTVTSHFGKTPSCLCAVCPCSGRGIRALPACGEQEMGFCWEKHRWKSLLIHLSNGSGRKALYVLMAEYQPMYHKAQVTAFFFFFFQIRLPTLSKLLSWVIPLIVNPVLNSVCTKGGNGKGIPIHLPPYRWDLPLGAGRASPLGKSE